MRRDNTGGPQEPLPSPQAYTECLEEFGYCRLDNREMKVTGEGQGDTEGVCGGMVHNTFAFLTHTRSQCGDPVLFDSGNYMRRIIQSLKCVYPF